MIVQSRDPRRCPCPTSTDCLYLLPRLPDPGLVSLSPPTQTPSLRSSPSCRSTWPVRWPHIEACHDLLALLPQHHRLHSATTLATSSGLSGGNCKLILPPAWALMLGTMMLVMTTLTLTPSSESTLLPQASWRLLE